MKKCKSCKYFERSNYIYVANTKFGTCNNPKLSCGTPGKFVRSDELLHCPEEGQLSFLYVGIKFGCRHHEKVNNDDI